MYQIRKQLTSDNILKLISEEDIFRHYIGAGFKIGTMSSPLREDKTPSFTVFPNRGVGRKLMFKDHALGVHGSCFDFVMLKYNLTFVEALQVINNDFNLNLECRSSLNISTVKEDFEYSKSEIEAVRAEFDIRYRSYNYADLKYWGQYNISPEILEMYNVKCVESYWLIRGNSTRFYRCHGKINTTYCYHFNTESGTDIKLYRPFDREIRFLSNCTPTTIQGMEQLPKRGKLLVDTKALKDIMTLRSFNIYAISPQSETIILSADTVKGLKLRFPNIFSLKDFDRAGIEAANKYRKLYGIEPYFLTNGRFKTTNYGSKDISDYVRDHGVTETIKLLKNLGLIFTKR